MYLPLAMLLLGLSSSMAQPGPVGPSCNIPTFGFDGYLLTLQWPISFCYKQGRCSLQRPLHQWVIHGLWPQFNASKGKIAEQISGSRYPQFCCHPQNQVDLAQLPNSLGEEMSQIWPSLREPRGSPQSNTFSFWRHEWTKHGTCALNPATRNSYTAAAYFLEAIKLYRQFQLGRWLTTSRIVPSNERSYSRQHVHDALETGSKLRGAFRLECDRPPQGPPGVGPARGAPSMLSEVQICLDINYNPISCALLFGERRQDLTLPSGSFDDFQCGHEMVLLES